MSTVSDIIRDPLYALKRAVLWLGSKQSIMALNGGAHLARGAGGTLLQVGSDAANGEMLGSGALFGATSSTIGLTVGVGLIAAVSATLTQMDFLHKKYKVQDFYKDELAAKLGKSPKHLTDTDLDLVAKGDRSKKIEANATIAEELEKYSRSRTFYIALSVIASLSAFAIVMALTGVGAPLDGMISGLAAKVGPGLAHFMVAGPIGLTSYIGIKTPLHWIGDKIFGFEKETTHDRIEALAYDREQGKEISPVQVLSVFAAAHPQLGDFIESKYGTSFEKMDLAGKQQAVNDIGQMIPLDQIAAGINTGKMNVSELAFAVQGQISGAVPKPVVEKKPGIVGRMLGRIFKSKEETHIDTSSSNGVTVSQTIRSKSMEYDNRFATADHVQRLGRPQRDVTLSNVERLEQQTIMPSVVSNSIH